MSHKTPIIFIVDDDKAVQDALHMRISIEGFTTKKYSSAREFLEDYKSDQHGCLILDIQMPGIDGMELQGILNDIGSTLPVIFITGDGDVPTAVGAMKAGAFQFLLKPFSNDELISHIRDALALDTKVRDQMAIRQTVLNRIEKLSPREKQVMQSVSAGKSNKKIAKELGLSPRTVEIYRSHVMLKMQVSSAVELVRLLDSIALIEYRLPA